MSRITVILVTLCAIAGAACDQGHEAQGPTLQTLRAALLGASDSVNGMQGPALSGLPATSEVWSVTRDWSDVTDEAGMAWSQHSGLDWHQKYAAWVNAFTPTASEDGHTTFLLTTPWGKSLPAPRLECAETAIFLRVTFAAWHGLPMYMGAYSPAHGANIYFGHFGVVHHSGARVSGFPKFASYYEDYTASHGDWTGAQLDAAWPSSASLAAKSLTTNLDDAVEFLGPDAYAGAYFDAVYLNKRVGEFLMRALTNLGSMHIVDDAFNTFNVAPEVMQPGDLMMQRWQQHGIGHTVVLLDVSRPGPNSRAIQVAYGSMPRIQPKWKTGGAAEGFFTAPKSGGPGLNEEGLAYAALGGGLKRWRTPIIQSGRWRNVVADDDEEHWINASHLSELAARTATFEALFAGPGAAEEKDLLLAEIADARAALRAKPSSCVQRTRREDAFEALYALNVGWFDEDVEATDRAHRVLDDYLFAELQYETARTCCWNSTTPAMYDLIMDFNEAHTWDAVSQTCHEPVVFKAYDGGYEVFADYAKASGHAALWSDWSADEPCPQAVFTDDLEAPHAWTSLCEIPDAILEMTPPPSSDPEGEEEDSATIDVNEVADHLAGGWKCGASSDTPMGSWCVMLFVLSAIIARRRLRISAA
jgi:hypothetical protein